MDWNNHFGKVFFEAWHKSGLQHFEEYVAEYSRIREQGGVNSSWIRNYDEILPGISGNQLHAVYGFGVAIGTILTGILGIEDDLASHTSDWCGRFNLGISLFDYICDEEDGLKSVTSLPVFQSFVDRSITEGNITTAANQLLSHLTESVLEDLKKVKAGDELLFNAMKQMFEAEHYITSNLLSDDADLARIEKALYIKSAVPFRVMAEYTVLLSGEYSLLHEKSKKIGNALGVCYWLIDDAKDVWLDLKARQWNLFLKIAANEDPLIFAIGQREVTENILLGIWKNSNHAQIMSNQAIEGIKDALKNMKITKQSEDYFMGLISASLWQWYNH